MRERQRPRHSPWVLLSLAALLVVALLLYRARPIAELAVAAGSTALVVIVVAHLSVAAAALGAFVSWRRHRR